MDFSCTGVEFNFGQSIWDKSVVLLETSWGTLCDLDGNLMGTHKEQQKNKRG
jgi:hypothetical protein